MKPLDIRKHLKVLVACEESQAVCKAFLEEGFDAWSCDIKPCSGGRPDRHIQGDCFDAINSRHWDMVIAHPPCTYITITGNRWFAVDPLRSQKRADAIKFFERFLDIDCPCLAIENPVGYFSRIIKPSQIIQPWQFGDSFSKKTCLWLKGLPLLQPTDIVSPGEFVELPSGKRMPKWYADAFRLPPEERSTLRSKTFPGIARAMASQWGDYLVNRVGVPCHLNRQLKILEDF